MKGFLITAVVVLCLAVGGTVYYAFMVMGERDELQAELTATQATLAATQQELVETKATLADTEATLTETEATLTATEEELAATTASFEAELASVQAELADTQEELSDIRMELASTRTALTTAESRNDRIQDDLDDTEEQLALAVETLNGLGITLFPSELCFDVKLADNPDAVNPTWAELKEFLLQDSTENHEYTAHVYDCSQFSRDLHNRAEAAGYRTAEVQVQFKGEIAGHALNAFLTSDYGLVYVDCTEAPDRIARVVLNKTYRSTASATFPPTKFRNNAWWDTLAMYYYIEASNGSQAVVSNIYIYW